LRSITHAGGVVTLNLGAAIDILMSTPLHLNHSKWGVTPLSIKNLLLDGSVSRTRGQSAGSSGPVPRGDCAVLLLAVLGLSVLISGCDGSSFLGGDPPLGPDPRQPTMSFEEASELLMGEEFDEAVDALRPFASQPVPTSEALLAYGHALVGAKRMSLAVWPLKRLVQRPDPAPMAERLYVTALLSGGAGREAVREATRLLERSPEAGVIRSLRSQGYESILDLEAAVEDMEILVDESPDVARLVERLLNLLIKLKDWDSAEERIKELGVLLERDGVSLEARSVFCATAARFVLDRGDPERAESEVRECMVERPLDPNLNFTLIEMLDASERVLEATEHLETYAAKVPGRPVIQQALASRYFQLGRTEAGESILVESARRLRLPGSWLALADHRVAVGDLQGASDAVDEAVKIATGFAAEDSSLDWSRMTPDSRFGLADVYIRAGKYERAERIVESLDDEPVYGLFLRARASLDRGDPASALEDYQEAFRGYSSNPAARYLAGRAALEVGDFDLAIEMYQNSLRADGTATDAGLVLAQMLIAQGRTNWAADVLGFYLTANPNEPHALRLMAQAGATMGRHEWSESVRGILAEDLSWAGVALADQSRDIGFLQGAVKAREYLEASPALEEPTHFEAFSAWVGLAADTKQKEQARTRARGLTKKHADSAGPWIVWSRILYEEGKAEEAAEAIGRAIELNPMIATSLAELGKMLLIEGKVDEAIEAFDRAREIDPLDSRAEISAADGLIEAERFEEAESRLRELLIRHPWHGRAALMLVNLVRDQGEVDEWTYQMARRAAHFIAISGPSSLLLLGELDLERGNFELAAASLASAIKLKYRVPESQYRLAQALVGLERIDEARELLELALASKELEQPLVVSALLEELKVKEQG
jgi:predicted Zn-dependent protease